MKKLLLIDPFYISGNEAVEKEFSLALITIGGYVKYHLHDCYKIDYFMPENSKKLPWRQWLDYLISIIYTENPDIIGCTTRCDTYPFTLELISQIKQNCPNTIMILGGPQATHTDLETMKFFPAIDIIIRGEGEITFVQVLASIYKNKGLDNILGITFRNSSNDLIRTPDRELMNTLESFPDYKGLIEKKNNILINRIEAGRGCPYNCIFCSLCKMWNRKYRLFEADEIIRNMNTINGLTGCTYFVLEHDNLLANKKEADRFLNRMVEINRSYTWSCSSRIDSINSIDIQLLKKAGCKNIFFGVETGSQKMQKIYNKNIDIDSIYKTLLELDSIGIGFIVSFICGHPLESSEDIEQTLLLAIKIKTLMRCNSVQIHKLAPLAGSEFLIETCSNLFLDDEGISDQSSCTYYWEYKSTIAENKNLFSSFYSVPLCEDSKVLVESIMNGWIEIINCFPKTLYYLCSEKSIQILKLLRKIQTSDGFISYITSLIKDSVDDILLALFSFEFELYRCSLKRIKFFNTFSNNNIKIYNSSQRIVSTYKYVLNFNIDTFKEDAKNNSEIKVRIWVEPRSFTIKYSPYTENQHSYMELCKNNSLISSLDNQTIEKLVDEGFLY